MNQTLWWLVHDDGWLKLTDDCLIDIAEIESVMVDTPDQEQWHVVVRGKSGTAYLSEPYENKEAAIDFGTIVFDCVKVVRSEE